MSRPTTLTIRLTEPWAGWLRTLAMREGRAPTSWVRRHVKVAAQMAKLPGNICLKGTVGGRRRKP